MLQSPSQVLEPALLLLTVLITMSLVAGIQLLVEALRSLTQILLSPHLMAIQTIMENGTQMIHLPSMPNGTALLHQLLLYLPSLKKVILAVGLPVTLPLPEPMNLAKL